MRIIPLFALTILMSAPALAHPKLVSASPAPNTAVAAPSKLQLNFSERLVGKFSGADLVMTAMPGMKMSSPMKVPARASVAGDAKSLVVSLPKPLGAGAYRLDYHVVSTDTHRVQGSYTFEVK